MAPCEPGKGLEQISQLLMRDPGTIVADLDTDCLLHAGGTRP
jgi:hypothetical protein